MQWVKIRALQILPEFQAWLFRLEVGELGQVAEALQAIIHL